MRTPRAPMRDFRLSVADAHRIPPQMLAGTATRRGRILIVEDDALIGLGMSAALAEAGHEVVEIVPSGAAALEIAHGVELDLALVDVLLRGEIDGVETARALRRIRPSLAIAFVTAQSDPGTAARIQAVGPAGHLVKPFETAELLRLVRRVLAP